MAMLYLAAVLVGSLSISALMMAFAALATALTWRFKEVEKVASAARIRKYMQEMDEKLRAEDKEKFEKLAEAISGISAAPVPTRKGIN